MVADAKEGPGQTIGREVRLAARHQSYRAETRDDLFALRGEDLLEAVLECVSVGGYLRSRRSRCSATDQAIDAVVTKCGNGRAASA